MEKWGDVILSFDGERDQGGLLIVNTNSLPVGFNGVIGEGEWVAVKSVIMKRLSKKIKGKMKNRKTLSG